MELTLTLTKEEVEEAIKLWVRETIIGSMSPLRIESVRRKSNYEDSFVVDLARVEKEKPNG